MIKLRIFTLSLLLLLPIFVRGYGSIKGTSLGEFSSCDYYLIEDSYGDYTLAEWYGGNTPDTGDVLYGELHSYGFKDLYNLTTDSETRAWIDDYLLSEDSAAEKLIDKCGYDKSISSYFDYDYGYSYSTYTPPPTPSCPSNSTYLNGQCTCDSGYKTDSTKTYCVKIPSCSEGYFLDTNNQCLTYTQGCKSVNNNDSKIIGTKGVDGKISCYCITGFTWNGAQCIANSAPVAEVIKTAPIEVKGLSSEQKYTPPKIDESKIELLDKEIQAQLKVSGAFRECPSTSCKVIRYYAETANVNVVGNYNNKEWFKVRAKDDNGKFLEGWMHKSLLEIANDQTQPVETQSIVGVTTTENVRGEKDSSWIQKLWKFIWRF